MLKLRKEIVEPYIYTSTTTIYSDDVKVSVLDAIINFAQTSKLKTIAEGVEEESQVSYLAQDNVFAI